jgi:hypothetical protein
MMENDRQLDWHAQKQLFVALGEVTGRKRQRIIGQIVDANMPLVTRFVAMAMRKDMAMGGLLRRMQAWNDLRQECAIAILENADRFELSRGIPFGGFIWPYFKGAAKRVLRQLRGLPPKYMEALLKELERGDMPTEVSDDEVSSVIDGPRETSVILDEARKRLPAWLTQDGGWEALAAVLADYPRAATAIDRWKARNRLVLRGKAGANSGSKHEHLLRSGDGVPVFRRWRFWRALLFSGNRRTGIAP